MSNVVKVDVREIINSPSALTREQGETIYSIISKNILQGKKTILDFQNIESLITPFLNVAIGKLYKDFSSEELTQKLEICHVPDGKAPSFNLVIENAKRYYKNKKSFCDLVKEEIDI